MEVDEKSGIIKLYKDHKYLHKKAHNNPSSSHFRPEQHI